MTTSNIHSITGGRYDLMASVSALCSEFHIPVEAEQRLCDVIAYCDAERFNLPYVAGAHLAGKRPFGTELRNIAARHDLTAKLLYSLDHVTCDEAGMLELFDRLGIFGAFEALHIATENSEFIPSALLPTRIAPLAPEHLMPIMRSAVATAINDETGMKASTRHDFRKKDGKLVAVPGRMADFILRVLALAGWNFTDDEIADNYKIVLMKRLWTRHPRAKPRPRPRA